MPEESPQRRILDKWSDYSYETMTKKVENVWPQYLLGSPQGFIMWGYPGTLCTMYCCLCFVNYITCGLRVIGILLNPKTRLEVYLGFLVYPLGFWFHIVLVAFLQLQPNQFYDI